MIEFRFDIKSTTQAAAMFLKLNGQDRPMKYLGLVKLLYMADREALRRMDQPITGDKYCSMDFGPVLSEVYDLIKGNRLVPEEDRAFWAEHISDRQDHEITLLKDPGNSDLCDEFENIISEVYSKYGNMDRFDLADLTHWFPEWQYPNGSSIPIPAEKILEALGKDAQEIAEIESEVAAERYLDQILNV
ncbi:hypothetical protein Pse7367_3041 [Thalassoporum mexicanum PCC 7367]|uniref:Panacea domain-containing protein n=1 Tax=Thalassoporum mexicanum TaxID=3457544 RepID=UPI00029F88C4|nr:Panacea domain-containing protein [Pseudanabaena sp. PCC 7367]AFY71290.1 hypothetical protein Pse7367_3041 [Pseudanabaena sp. PCC 7367]